MKSAFAAVILAATAVAVQAQQVKLEDQVKYRRAAYTLMSLNFGSLAAMAQDKKPFNRDEAIRNADFVAMLSTVPKLYFGEGTDKDTKAKPEIWTNRADFDAKMDKMAGEAQKLPAAVRAGDMAAFKKQVGDVGSACKACHDEYRLK
ncbi:MAG TPA: cytochrome c [Usitatibacter sp.]